MSATEPALTRPDPATCRHGNIELRYTDEDAMASGTPYCTRCGERMLQVPATDYLRAVAITRVVDAHTDVGPEASDEETALTYEAAVSFLDEAGYPLVKPVDEPAASLD